jgi:predicted nucleotidyltransferase component of viral defense system
MNQMYLDTARLLTQVAPLVFVDSTFALKGGTAINLFVRELPRLSVDLDLVFPDYTIPRAHALAAINDSIREAAGRLTARGFQVHTSMSLEAGETKLLVRRGSIEVKVEVNFVMRGTIHPVRTVSLTPRASEVLLADLEVPLVSLEDLYGGKLAAAMDRQHPRDLFDVLQLLEHEGITPGIRQAFVVYLASHNRPIHEVLFPIKRDIAQEYDGTFRGMTAEPVALQDLLKAREQMMTEIQQGLNAAEREFLVSLARNEPDWTQLGIPHLAELPAIRWKLQNLSHLARTNPRKFQTQAAALEEALS